MNQPPVSPDFDPRIADWLENDPTQAPGTVLNTVLAAFPSITQRRRSRLPWRSNPMNRLALFGAAAAISVVLVGAVLLRQGPGTGTGSSPPPASQPLSSPSPSASAPVTACGLVTADEAERLNGNVGSGAQPSESGSGPETACLYQDGGGNVVLRLTYTATGGLAAFDAARVAAAEAQPVDSVAGADAAFYDPSTSTLYVRKGDGLVELFAGTFGQAPGSRQDIEAAIGEVAVTRMPATQ